MNDEFVSSFTKEDLSSILIPDQMFNPNDRPQLSSVVVDVETVVVKLDALNLDKSLNKCLAEGVVTNRLKNVGCDF